MALKIFYFRHNVKKNALFAMWNLILATCQQCDVSYVERVGGTMETEMEFVSRQENCTCLRTDKTQSNTLLH